MAVYRHNGIAVRLVRQNQCCGMPKLELGDLDTVEKYKNDNLPYSPPYSEGRLGHRRADSSCVLMFASRTAADVPGRRRGAGRQSAPSTIPSNT